MRHQDVFFSTFDAMSNRERAHSRSSGGIRDIGLFVENYKSLWDKLFPVFAVWDIVLYVARYIMNVNSSYICGNLLISGISPSPT